MKTSVCPFVLCSGAVAVDSFYNYLDIEVQNTKSECLESIRDV